MTYPVIPDRPASPTASSSNPVSVEQYVMDHDDDISGAICDRVFDGLDVANAAVDSDHMRLIDYITGMLTDMPDDLRGVWAHTLDASIPTFDQYKAECKRRLEDLWELKTAAWLAHNEHAHMATAHRGHEWKLVRVVRRVCTKAGLSFSAGEETIAKLEISTLDGSREVIAYSFHTRADTLLRTSDVEWLTE